MIALSYPTLSTNELEGIKSALYDFVIRVSSDNEKKMPEEVKILPAVTEILLRFID